MDFSQKKSEDQVFERIFDMLESKVWFGADPCTPQRHKKTLSQWQCKYDLSLLIFLDSHFFNKAIQAFIVLCLADRTGGKECVEQFLLTTEQLLLLFCRG